MSADEKRSNEDENGPVPMWDAHVHCYPETVIADPQGWAKRLGEPYWARLVSEGPQGWAGPEDLLRTMDAEGIEKVLLQAWYWENPETARIQNDWHAEWINDHADRFFGCAAIHPAFPDPVGVLNQAKAWGACAVGECLPHVQSHEGWGHPAWEAILEKTTAEGWPLALHVTEPVGHEYAGRLDTPLMELVEKLEQHPNQKWLCAHWGGGLPFYSLNRRVRTAIRNVWFDTAAGPLLYDARIWRMVCDLIGPEKIIFGSDFPLRLYPRKEREPGWKRLLEEFLNSGLSVVEQRAIGRENLKQLLGIGQADVLDLPEADGKTLGHD